MIKWFNSLFKHQKPISAELANDIMQKSIERNKIELDKCKEKLMHEIYQLIYANANKQAESIDITMLITVNLIKYCNKINNPDDKTRKEVIDYISEKLSHLGYIIEIEPKEGNDIGAAKFRIYWKLDQP